MKTYEELLSLATYEDRFNYLKLNGKIADITFGGSRYLNQLLYQNREWKKVRDRIIVRDNGCDLGLPGYELYDFITVHHINPISKEDILNNSLLVLDPNNLITVGSITHKAIHYGQYNPMANPLVIRKPGDTKLW